MKSLDKGLPKLRNVCKEIESRIEYEGKVEYFSAQETYRLTDGLKPELKKIGREASRNQYSSNAKSKYIIFNSN